MFSRHCPFFLKTSYIFMKSAVSSNVINNISANDYSSFDSTVGLLSLNHELGTPQHKKALFLHLFNHRYNIRQIYNLSKFKHKIRTHETVGPSSNFMTEFPVMEQFLDIIDFYVKFVEITSDLTQTSLPGQKQSNMDYVVHLTPNEDCNNNPSTITRFHDCKDGNHMFRHSTRGSLGFLVFDENGRNIQTMRYEVTEEKLLDYNKDRLKSLTEYVKRENLSEFFMDSIQSCYKELDNYNRGKSIFEINSAIEHILFHNIQRHHLFPRSISCVFLHKTRFNDQLAVGDDSAESYYRFQYDMKSGLQDKIYDLNKIADRKEYYNVLFKSYKKVDPSIRDRFLSLKEKGLDFSTVFEEILKNNG